MSAQSRTWLSRFSGRVQEVAPLPAIAPTITSAELFVGTYERLGLGGLWTTDCAGRLTFMSAAIAGKLAPCGLTDDTQLCELFSSEYSEKHSKRHLRLALSRRTRFERMLLRSGAPEPDRWWSVSGEAQYNQGGEFLGFVGFCSDVTEEQLAVLESEAQAMHDLLTGLSNRRCMTGILDRTLKAFSGQNRCCATLLIDLDRFKQVNDTLGHSVGDALLKQVAERLVTVVGDRECVFRLGGDEFQVILADQEDRGKLGTLAERIISMLSQPYSVDGSRCIIGASVGIAISPFDGTSQEELVRNADLALYAAKHGGRGRFRFFARDLLKAAEDRRRLEEDLHDALEKGEFEVFYQPVVGANSNRVSGAEALIRWNHPTRGRISPTLFIPIAEESTLICRIGEWTLRKGCVDAATWPAPLRVAINVSPIQFTDPGFADIVACALAKSGLAPDRLELEITEGVFLAGGSSTDNTFRALKDLGVRLALDDFGTGYSSLSYLKSAPFDKIKIDQSFVRGAIEHGLRNRAIISAIVAMANAIGMETTAEGVETFDQLEMVRAHGVSHIQGYIYSPPVCLAEFAAKSREADWGIEPDGYAKQRHERIRMYRKIGAIHEDQYYTVMLRNLSASGALIEGLVDVPVGTQFVIDFGEGQLEIATVRRSRASQQGIEFESCLVSDGEGGLCTRTRVSPYLLASAGLPDFTKCTGPQAIVGENGGKIAMPLFLSALDRKAIVKTGSAD